MRTLLFILIGCFDLLNFCTCDFSTDLLIFTVATEDTDGFHRFMRSASRYDLDVQVLGRGIEWRGGDVKRFAGGGHKVNLLRAAVEKYKFRDDLVILFVDSYDVVFDASADEILLRFTKFESKVVFSAEGFCWPDKSLTNKYPIVRFGKRFLNSGGYLGIASTLHELISYKSIEDNDDDQLFFTHAFLDKDLRTKFDMKLDSLSEIFQNLNGAIDDLQLDFADPTGKISLKNIFYESSPLIIHGNGASKNYLNYFGNYLAHYWTPLQCEGCLENNLEFNKIPVPSVTIALFVEKPTPFITEFFQRILKLSYPVSKTSIFVHNKEVLHANDVNAFVEQLTDERMGKLIFNADDTKTERDARNDAIEFTLNQKSDFLFVVDSEAQLTNSQTLKFLIEQNRNFVAPLLTRPGKLWSNFWGAVNEDGYYARSEDYIHIVQLNRRGLWNVPYVNGAYLIKAGRLQQLKNAYSQFTKADPDMSLCEYSRSMGYFMYLSNLHDFGHLVNTDSHEMSTHVHSELYQIFDNRKDWEARYIHENYSLVLDDSITVEQPCTDVYWFPVLSETFCWHLIEEMEHFGQWSDGSNNDARLNGGYENVPTRDIHMNQVGLEKVWLHFLDNYVRPVQERVYSGYFSQPPRAIMNFVVRYRPGEQDSLRPHHDASTYTINVNLNRPTIDYEGGGARFIRYNCSVVELRQGWALMHPGRLTHYHEGLKTTSGTRYIMVSFIDP